MEKKGEKSRVTGNRAVDALAGRRRLGFLGGVGVFFFLEIIGSVEYCAETALPEHGAGQNEVI
jgi:hypothetical protein